MDTSALPDPWYQKIRPIACDGAYGLFDKTLKDMTEVCGRPSRNGRGDREHVRNAHQPRTRRARKGGPRVLPKVRRGAPVEDHHGGCGATRGRPLRRMRSEAPVLGNEGGAAAQEGREDPSTNVDRICGFRIEPLRDGHLEFTELEEKHFFVARLVNDLQGSENRRGGVQRCPRGDSCSLPRRHGARLRERDRLARRVLGIDDEPRGGFDYVKRVPKKWPEDLFWNCSDDRGSNAARS